MRDFAAAGRAILDSQLYMVLGTADADGRPWAAPVYFAHAAYSDFFWVSKPQATHSRNLAVRPEVSIVAFDSSVPIGRGEAVYVAASARELGADECAEGLRVFSERSCSHGGAEWTLEDVQAPARHRLYRARAEAQYVLDEHDERVAVSL